MRLRFLRESQLIAVALLSGSLTSATAQDSVSDIDGNTYSVVKIGTQIWMAENLRTVHYANGEAIPEVKEDVTWAELTTGSFCLNDNNQGHSTVYGLLYNWFAVQDQRKLCPAGWHVPSANDWKKLETFLGGPGSAGGKLKAAGTDKWIEPNAGADNSSGFKALPGGSRNSDGSFNPVGETGHWWTSNEFAPTTAWHRQLYNNAEFIDNVYAIKNEGCSVRCIKD